MQFAEAVASSGTLVWMYRLQCGGTLGAIHGYEGSLIHAALIRNPMSEIPSNEDPYAVAAESYALATAMREAWVAFIQSGDPNIHARRLGPSMEAGTPPWFWTRFLAFAMTCRFRPGSAFLIRFGG